MEWQSILIDALSVTSVLSIIGLVRFWNQNKKLKNNEVKKDDIETQKAEIELGTIYKKEMLEVINLLKTSQVENNNNQNKVIGKLDNLDTRLEKVEIKMDNIETYLNGPYHAWLAEKEQAN